jgi:hypothetical protein
VRSLVVGRGGWIRLPVELLEWSNSARSDGAPADRWRLLFA